MLYPAFVRFYAFYIILGFSVLHFERMCEVAKLKYESRGFSKQQVGLIFILEL